MAKLAFPRVTVSGFSVFQGTPGQIVYEAQGGQQYVVGIGASRFEGTLTLTPQNEDENRALIAFHVQLDGINNEVALPWFREWNGDGLFPFGTGLVASAVADAADDDQSTVTMALTLPSGKGVDDIALKAGGFLTVNDMLVRLTADAMPTATAATVTVTPRLPATTAEITVSEAVVVARLDGRQGLLQDGQDIAGSVTYSWTEREISA